MRTNIRMKYLTRDDVNTIKGLSQIIVERVEDALAVKGMTNKKFGERAGITNPSYARSWWPSVRRSIQLGKFNPSIGHVLRFARAIGCRPKELMTPFNDTAHLRLVAAARSTTHSYRRLAER